MPAKVSMKIDKTGNVTLEVSGAIGMECEALTRCFEDALGTVTDTQRKPEYFLDSLSTDTEVFVHED